MSTLNSALFVDFDNVATELSKEDYEVYNNFAGDRKHGLTKWRQIWNFTLREITLIVGSSHVVAMPHRGRSNAIAKTSRATALK